MKSKDFRIGVTINQYDHSFQNNLRTEACLKEDIYCNHLLSVMSMPSSQVEKKITFSLRQHKKRPAVYVEYPIWVNVLLNNNISATTENMAQLKALKSHIMKANRLRIPQPASAIVGCHKKP